MQQNQSNIIEILGKLSLKEKAALCSGGDDWNTKGIERLDINSFRFSDGPHGLRMPEDNRLKRIQHQDMQAVCFPEECLCAASFDCELLYQLGKTLGEECRARGIDMLLGPAINIKRTPLCGRNFEYFSEDPYLTALLGAAYVEGVQSQVVGACIKHFFANNQESGRLESSSDLDERTEHEIYLSAFEYIIQKADPWAVMASYNKINGIFSTENRKYLIELLRTQWNYQGCVISDWGAVHDRIKALSGGCDLTMPGAENTDDQLAEAVEDGRLLETELDNACDHILTMVRKAEKKKAAEIDYRKDHDFCRTIAENSAVLLKNDSQILPLRSTQNLAFIGDFVEHPRIQGRGSAHVYSETADNLWDFVRKSNQISYAQGYDSTGTEIDWDLIKEAKQIAEKAEIAVIFAGLLEEEEQEGFDRKHMKLPENQTKLILEIASVQPDIVIVLYNGSPVEMPWIDRVKGVLEMYLPGEAAAEATWNLLFGNSNPSGRLPETFPRYLEDTPTYLYSTGKGQRVEYREGVFVGYRYYESKHKEVLFPFGYGLSYTTFTYSNLKLDKKYLTEEDEIEVNVDVINAGNRFGKEVVQIYIEVEEPDIPRPIRELRAFKKIGLFPGEKKTVTFSLGKRAFSYWDSSLHQFYLAGGKYKIEVCSSAHTVLLSQEIFVEDQALHPQIGGRAEDALRVNWNQKTKADKYRLELCDENGRWKKIAEIEQGDTLTYRITGLRPNTNYNIRICTLTTFPAGEICSAYEGIHGKTIPKRPTDIEIAARTENSVILTWKGDPSVTGYCIEQKAANRWVRIGKISEIRKPTFCLNEFSADADIELRIKSFSYDGAMPIYSVYETFSI